MKIKVGGRGAGKTYEAVRWVKEDPERVMLVFSHEEKRRVERLYDIPPKQVVVASPPASLLGMPRYDIWIDNLDIVLEQWGVKVATMSQPVERWQMVYPSLSSAAQRDGTPRPSTPPS